VRALSLSLACLLHPGCEPNPANDTAPPFDTGPFCTSGAVSDHQGIAMAYVCPGRFTLGSPEDEVGRYEDEFLREVTLSRGYHLGVHEVTVDEFIRFVGRSPWEDQRCDGGRCVARNIYWHEGAAFATAVSEAAGLEPCYSCVNVDDHQEIHCDEVETWASPYDCPGYRLPTEVEWEVAARAGTSSAFSNGANLLEGDEYDCDGDVVLDDGSLLDDIAVYCGSEGTDDGWQNGDWSWGRRAPNPWGLYDMHGNLLEWCHDDYIYQPESGLTDPWGEDAEYKVARGGSFFNSPRRQRSAYRSWHAPYEGSHTIGFRLARSE
jgi:formylglycine-generating enzyme required for sulfatase activity